MNDPIGCGCEPQMQRPILTTLSHLGWMVVACLRCGETACTEPCGDDGRFSGEAVTVYVPVALPDGVKQWISKWPRISATHRVLWPMRAAWVPRDGVFLPASLRCSTLAELAAAEDELRADQQAQTVRERIKACGFPSDEAPSGLPGNLVAFAMTAAAMQLTAASGLDTLIHHAQLASAASGVAAELIAQRADAAEFFAQSLCSKSVAQLGVALAMMRVWTQPPPDTAALILDQLQSIPLIPHRDIRDRIEAWESFELLLLILAELRPAAPETSSDLRALMRQIARHDADLVNCIRAVLSELSL